MLGKKYGYYPKEPREMWQVDSIIMANGDVMQKIWDTLMCTEEEKQENEQELLEVVLPNYCVAI